MAEQGLPISEAAHAMGISVDSLRKRVQRRSVKAYKGNDGQWRVVLPVGDLPETSADERPTSGTAAETAPTAAIISPADQFARVIEQAIAPYAARLEAVSREAGELRVRLEHAERERDDLRRQLDAPAAREQASDGESPPQTTNVAPGGAGEAERALEKPQRWPWWMRILAGK